MSFKSIYVNTYTVVLVNLETKMKDVASSFVQSFGGVHILFGLLNLLPITTYSA